MDNTQITGLTATIGHAKTEIKKKRFVKTDSTGAVSYSGAGENAIGISAYDYDVSEQVGAIINGLLWIEVGAGGLSAGDEVSSDANGKGVKQSSASKVLALCVNGAPEGGIAIVRV